MRVPRQPLPLVWADRDRLIRLRGGQAFDRWLRWHDGACVTLALVDIKEIRAVNVDYGFLAGDAMIAAVATALRNATPPGGRLYRRYGGTFIVAVPGVEGAIGLGEAIRRAASFVRRPDGQPVEVAIGVTSGPAGPGLLDEADRARFADRWTFSADPDPVTWAAGVLEAGCTAAGIDPPEVAHVLTVARDRTRWAEGHAAFDRVRREVLRRDSGEVAGDAVEMHVLALAELVAKLAYNGSRPLDPFDGDTPWKVEPLALGLASLLPDPGRIHRSLRRARDAPGRG